MRVYNNLVDAINHTIGEVKNSPTKTKAGIWQATDNMADQDMLVIRNCIFYVPISNCPIHLREVTGCDLPWAEDHFQERVEGIPSNPGRTYKWWPYHKNLDNSEFKEEKFSHTYQERFWPKHAERAIPDSNFNLMPNMGIRYSYGDLNDVIKQLKENPLTRQAYLPIFFPEDTGAVHKQRVPCTLGYYFYIDKDRLHINYIIRSCDIFRHFRNDLYLTGRLLQHVGEKINMPIGNMTFMCFHLHLFVNDLYALNKRENGKNK